MKFRVPTGLFPFEHRWLDLRDGGTLHYVDEGKGPPLFLCHGNPTWSFLYRKLIPKLADRFRCVAADLPGFGLSRASTAFQFTPEEHSRALEQLVDHLGLCDLTIVGHDWGGPTGLGLAGRRPELVSRLVLGNTFAWPLTEDANVRRFSRLAGGRLGRAAAWGGNAVVRFFLRAGIRRGLSAEDRAMYLAPFVRRESRYPTAFFARQLIEAGPWLADVERSLAVLADRPALLLWATRDFAFGDAYRDRFERMFPNHKSVALLGAGHFWQEDAAPEAVEAIRAWAEV